jgi:hypothetical protein
MTSPIDAAREELRDLDDLDVTEHPERFDRAHQLLREELTRPADA